MLARPMNLSLSDQLYTVDEATLIASPAPKELNCLLWRLEVESEDEGLRFWHQEIQIPQLKDWKELVGHSIRWSTPRNPVTGDMDYGWYGGHIICGHLEILEAELRFVQREKCQFRLQWNGVCSGAPVGCEPLPEERLSFSIDCWCVFEGVRFSSRETAAQFLDLSDFVEVETDTTILLKPRY